MRNAGYLLLVFVGVHLCFFSTAQPGTTIDLKKPEKYERRTLGAEKTTEGKIKPGKKFYQNTVTHYNYFFNANLKLNEIVARAKQGFKDDFTQLLPYYNYTLDITSSDPDLDSVIYKCNAGILLHDLRNDWVDDLYFLMGRAYYLRKDFDSAEHVFLYVNYAFAPKEEGYDIPIGSSANSKEFSIASKEKKSLLANPPRRNEDLIWVAKNYIEDGKPYEASAILEMLRYDPNFPERLQPDLHETIGYLFYQSKIYDSAAFHLSKATDMDDNKQDKARREYLTAQLYMASGLREEAEKYFVRSAEHTVDPYLAVYANLNAINASPDSSNAIDKKIESLMRLAHKDRYIAYRDLIYYTAAQVEMENNNYPQAYDFTKKSIKYNVGNAAQHSKSFMLLGDLEYLRPDYEAAKNAYDSVDMSSLAAADQPRYTVRAAALEVISENIKIIHTEDSLQAVAKLPEAQRTALIRKTVRQLRKAQGLKEEEETSTFSNPAVQLSNDNNNSGNPTTNDLFAAQAAAKGEWYFNNNSLKSSGFTTFRSAWGGRPEVDNWRRLDAVNKQLTAASQGNPDEPDGDEPDSDETSDVDNNQITKQASPSENLMQGEISYDALLAYLPLTEEKLKESNSKIADALFANGQQFKNELENYVAAINTYDTLLKRFPENSHLEETLFDLYFCYNKLGKKFSADSAMAALKSKFKDGKYAKLTGKPAAKTTQKDDAATKEYEKIYDLFIEGKFEEAKTAKAAADSVYGNSYWTPQLLYIESIYYVSKREDSTAIATLTSLTEQFSSSPLSQKAETMIDVLGRRKEIEDYLTALQVTRLPDDEPSPIVNLNPIENIVEKKGIKKDSVITKPAAQIAKATVVDSMKTVSGAVRTYVFNANDKQFAGIMLNKVDPVYQNETRNAFNRYNQINFYSQKINVSSIKVNDSLTVVLLGPFSDAASALIYVEKVRPKAAGVIVPWLKPDKYSFTIISQPNLDVMNDTKDVNGYKSLLEKVLPGKF